MSEKNSMSLIQFVGGIIGGVVSIIIALYMLVYAPLNSAIAKEMELRAECDKAVIERADKVAEKLVKTQAEQSSVNTSILITLAKIEGRLDLMSKDITYMKEREVKNGT